VIGWFYEKGEAVFKGLHEKFFNCGFKDKEKQVK